MSANGCVPAGGARKKAVRQNLAAVIRDFRTAKLSAGATCVPSECRGLPLPPGPLASSSPAAPSETTKSPARPPAATREWLTQSHKDHQEERCGNRLLPSWLGVIRIRKNSRAVYHVERSGPLLLSCRATSVRSAAARRGGVETSGRESDVAPSQDGPLGRKDSWPGRQTLAQTPDTPRSQADLSTPAFGLRSR
jgi:hypothetical protein